MKHLLSFGEDIEGYNYKVINEREARASAGLMFLLGILSMFGVYIERSLIWAELFSITFVIEFIVRVLINPKYAPYMLIGELIVRNQEPEWVDAKPKRFAWTLGLLLGAIMTYYIVFNIVSPIRLSICLVCLSLLYLESAFGICLGCKLYEILHWKTYKCPGNVCEYKPKAYPKIKLVIIAFFLLMSFFIYEALKYYKFHDKPKIIIVRKHDSINNTSLSLTKKL